MIGRTLSHYKVLDEIGRGGMGIVYKALDLRLNREVALKVLPPDLVFERGRRRRFAQEAKAAAAIKHPNIAVVYDIDEEEGETFITRSKPELNTISRSDARPLSSGSPDLLVEPSSQSQIYLSVNSISCHDPS